MNPNISYEQYRNRPTGWGSGARNRPMWQTSQQGWAVDRRNEEADRLQYESMQRQAGMAPEQKIIEGYQTAQRIADQGGGRGIAAGANLGAEAWNAIATYKTIEDALGDLREKAAQRQEAEEQRKFNRESRARSRSMLADARKGMGLSSKGGSYRISGV